MCSSVRVCPTRHHRSTEYCNCLTSRAKHFLLKDKHQPALPMENATVGNSQRGRWAIRDPHREVHVTYRRMGIASISIWVRDALGNPNLRTGQLQAWNFLYLSLEGEGYIPRHDSRFESRATRAPLGYRKPMVPIRCTGNYVQVREHDASSETGTG